MVGVSRAKKETRRKAGLLRASHEVRGRGPGATYHLVQFRLWNAFVARQLTKLFEICGTMIRLDWIGLDWIGLDWIRSDQIRSDSKLFEICGTMIRLD